jgi:integrase
MPKITFRFMLHSHELADGTHKIILRITQERKHKYVDIGYSVKAADWNNEKKEVRKTNPLWREIKMVMDSKLLEAQKTYLNARAQDATISASEIKRQLRKELVGESYLDYATDYIAKMPNASSQLSRESMINKLKEFLGKGQDRKQIDLLFPEINYKFLKDYERHLKRIGNNDNTIGGNMKFLKTVYKDALKTKHYRTLENPWYEYAAPAKKKSTRTRLKAFQIEDIEQLETKENTRKHDAKSIFLFSFYLQGMRVKDLLRLRWSQIKGDYLYYKASKTEKGRPRKLITKAKAILAYYKQHRNGPTDFVFPYLRGIDETAYLPKQYVKLLDAKNSQIRNELMRMAKELGLEKLSMHVARHTFANIARQATGDIHVVSDALDHSSIAVTEKYFGDAAPEENDDLVKKVFGE